MKNPTIDYSLRTSWLAVKKMYDAEARKHDHTMSIGFTLLSIDPKLGSSSTSLGPKMGIEANSLSRLLKSMEEKKLIKRKPNPSDGRGIIIFLTKKGIIKRDITREKVFRFNSLMNKRIGKEKIYSFHKTASIMKRIILEEKIF